MTEIAELGVGLMARAPNVGSVKTRLAADIGAENATEIYRDLLRHISADIIKATKQLCGGSVSFCWFADPEDSIPALRKKYAGFAGFFAQGDGDLGQRMRRALERLLQSHKYAALIGADIPDISAEHIEKTLSALREHDVVLGPTLDGGYYLIGVRQIYGELFSGIPWSATDTLEKTISACKSSNLNYYILETLGDIDVLADFSRVKWRPQSTEIDIERD